MCKLCGRDFRLSYSPVDLGSICWTCQPEGFKIVRMRPKVRRVDNVFGHGSAEWAEGN